MNDAVKGISKMLEKMDIHYDLTEDESGLVISLLSEELGITIRYLIDTTTYEDGSYKLTIFTSELVKVKNEIEVLKTLNDINWNNSFITYLISDKKQVHIRIETLDNIENIANDSITFIRSIIDNLEANYDKIMKSNWS